MSKSFCRQVIDSDLEGPWVKADHAHECLKLIKNGELLFKKISIYDDYLCFVKEKEGYNPGDTLALIAPFLISYGISDKNLIDVARKNALFINSAIDTIKTLSSIGYTMYLISTSYDQFVHHIADFVGIPIERTYCTNFPIDIYKNQVSAEDKQWITSEVIQNILELPEFSVDTKTKITDISEKAQEAIDYMNNFFWKELPKTSFAKVMQKVKPVGGIKKYDALINSLDKENIPLNESIFIGDSITDSYAQKKVKDAGGLSIAFNGNGFGTENATVAIISDNTTPTAAVCDIFTRAGHDKLEDVIENWSLGKLKESKNDGILHPQIYELIVKETRGTEIFPQVFLLENSNFDEVVSKSSAMRSKVRGRKVGSLG